MPLVSFCFTTYKRGEVLKSTLHSIQRQTFTDYEVIVSDNDPESSGRTFVESLADSRFKYFPNGKNLGMKPSFNKSLERSSGEYIVMIADDDPVYYNMLETLVNLSKEYPGYGLYMGGSDWFCTDPSIAKLNKLNIGTNSHLSNEYEIGFIRSYTATEFLIHFFTGKIFPAYLWSTCMVRRDILIKIGGVPDYGTPFMGDYAYLGITGVHSGCVAINTSLGYQAIHTENFGRNQNEQLSVVAQKFPEYFSQHLSHLKEWEHLQKVIKNFIGLWVIAHMAFLYRHYKKNKISLGSLHEAEREVFKISYVKKYRIKYIIKKKFPHLHDLIVTAKKIIKGLFSKT